MIIIPRKKFIVCLSVPLIFFIAGMFSEAMITVGIIADLVIFAFFAIDIISLLSEKQPEISTEQSRVFSINTDSRIGFSVSNYSETAYLFKLSLRTPDNWKRINEDREYVLKPKCRNEITLGYRPLRRGAVRLDRFYYRYSKRNSFFWIQKPEKQKIYIDVIPDITLLKSMVHFSRVNRLHEMGVHKNAYQGIGSEFESLREYQDGENADDIDWKVSTRVGRPVTRVYQMETNNNITFIIDCGRCMTAEQNGINSLDHAINSMLLLSHIAIQAGDSVNLVFFADGIISEAYNLKGKSGIQKIKQMSSSVTARMMDSDFGKVFSYISLKLKKRSYIMVFSDLIDSVQYAIFLKYMQFLQKKHVPLLVLLQDKDLSGELGHMPETRSELYRSAVAAEMYMQRSLSIEKLKKHRIMVLDVLPARLSPPLVNKYYQIKSANRI